MTTAPTPPLLKADSATIAFRAEKDGSLRATYASWTEAVVCRPGEGLKVVNKGGQVQVFRIEVPVEKDPYAGEWV